MIITLSAICLPFPLNRDKAVVLSSKAEFESCQLARQKRAHSNGLHPILKGLGIHFLHQLYTQPISSLPA